MRRRSLIMGFGAAALGKLSLALEEEPEIRISLNRRNPEKSEGRFQGARGDSFAVGFGRNGFREGGKPFIGGSSLLGQFRVNAILTSASFQMTDELVKMSGRSREWLSRNLFRNMNSIDFDGDGRGGEYGSAFIGLEPIASKAKQPFHFGEYKGVFRWYSYAIHGTQNESRIGKMITGGCINVGEVVLQKLIKELRIGSVVEVVDGERLFDPL